MIIDLERFIRVRRSEWQEYEKMLQRLEGGARTKLSLEDAKRFHFLYERTSADLNKINTYASEPETQRYLESLVSRGYSEIHQNDGPSFWKNAFHWFWVIFPTTVRKHSKALAISVAVFMAGILFGGFALILDPDSKDTLMPFSHLLGDPSERVAEEEATKGRNMDGGKGQFSAMLITNNTKVAIFTLALGMLFGAGTLIVLFYNGIGLGAVIVDYVMAGESIFLMGWLLPHGSTELPAIMLAGQAGLVLGHTLFAAKTGLTLSERLSRIRNDLATLIGGVAVLLIWAGIVESFFSQYHEPILPYSVKIAFGVLQIIGLLWFLTFCGKRSPQLADDHA